MNNIEAREKNEQKQNTPSLIDAYQLCSYVLDAKHNDVEPLIELSADKETAWLEFKASCEKPKDESSDSRLKKGDYRWNVAEAVIALANTHGGCVLLGVDDEATPIGLDASDPKNIRNNQSTDAFFRHLEDSVLRPTSGWACNISGNVSIYNEYPHDLFELRLGTLYSKEVAVILVRPLPAAEICPACALPKKYQCLHCIEHPKGLVREYMPVRSLGELGKIKRLFLSAEWQEWEKTRSPKQFHYSELLQRLSLRAKTDWTLKGLWHGAYKERKTEYPFKIEIHEEELQTGVKKTFEGNSSEPKKGRTWVGQDIDNVFADIQGNYDSQQKKLFFRKIYRRPFQHAFDYEGKLIEENLFQGTWTPCKITPKKTFFQKFFLRRARRAGSFYLWRKESLKVLITGFEPFGNYKTNSSQEIAASLEEKKQQIYTEHVYIEQLPVDYNKASAALEKLLTQHRPDLCLCMGMANSKRECHIETKARKPKQFKFEGERVLKGTWPFDDLAKSLVFFNVPAKVSNKAGKYVCESTYWALLEFRQKKSFPLYAGFLHVPNNIDYEMIENITAGIIKSINKCLSEGTW